MDGPAVSGEPHHLVFALVDREPEIGREGGIEHPQRMRKAQLPRDPDPGGAVGGDLALAERQRGPLADSVRGEDGRPPGRGCEERGRRMRLVMFAEKDPAAADAELRRDGSPYPELAAERVLHRTREAP